MCAVRAWGDTGAITVVRELGGELALSHVAPNGTLTVSLARGAADVHRPPGIDSRREWRLRRERAGEPLRELHLAIGGAPISDEVTERVQAEADATIAAAAPLTLAPDVPTTFTLGDANYRRSEDTWREAGRPAARVTLTVRDDRLRVDVAVHLDRPTSFVPPSTENPLDNERAGINGDGVQLHLGAVTAQRVEPVGAWLLVPVIPGGAVDVTRTTAPDPTADGVTPAATWAPAPDGYALRAELPLGPLRARAFAHGAPAGAPPVIALDVLVNEKPGARERRRGQLVLSGLLDPDERVYLAGDRHDPARLLRLALPPG